MTTALTEDRIRQLAPSVFASTPWHKMSDRYGFVPTIDVVRGLWAEGFICTSARQSRSRIEGKTDFTRHALRFRPADAPMVLDGVFPEFSIINSHDGSSCYEIDAGLYRLWCLNGATVPIDGKLAAFKARHKGDLVAEVVEASHQVMRELPGIVDRADAMRTIELTPDEQGIFARAALALRYDEGSEPIQANQLLTPRRREDLGSDLWLTFNRVQENIIKGAPGSRRLRDPRTGRRRSMRAVGAITEDIRLNKALWVLAEAMRQAKAA